MLKNKENKREISTFRHLCKDLFKYIQRKIIKKYVDPNSFNSHKEIDEEKDWKYYDENGNLSSKEKIINIFKDNSFLKKVQKTYQSLESVITSLDDNSKNSRLFMNDDEMIKQKLELLSNLNLHLNKFFKKEQIQSDKDIDNNMNKFEKDDNLIKSLNIINKLYKFNSNNYDNNKNNNVSNNYDDNYDDNKSSSSYEDKIDDNRSSNSYNDKKDGNRSCNSYEDKKDDIKSCNSHEDKKDDNRSCNSYEDKKDDNNTPNNYINKKDDKTSEFSINSINTSITNITNVNNDQNFQDNNELLTVEDMEMKQINYETDYSLYNVDVHSTPKFLNKKCKRELTDIEGNDLIEIDFNDEIEGNNKGKFAKNRKKNNKIKNVSKTIVKTSRKYLYQKNYSFSKNNNRKKNIERNKSNKKIDEYENVSFILPGKINKKSSIKKVIDDEKIEKMEKENNKNIELNEENIKDEDKTPEIEFEEIIKREFPSIYEDKKNYSLLNKEITFKLNALLRKTKNIKFNQNDKFEDPYLTGSYSHFKVIHLIKYLPPIDIVFKCKQILNMDELKKICCETIETKLSLNYEEISNECDKKNEIILFSNKCGIKLKNKNIFYIKINIIFVLSQKGLYNKKELFINQFAIKNNIWKNKQKHVLFLFFRRWRRKFELFFIIPEFLDILINNYFNEKDSIPKIIQSIFYNLFHQTINFNLKENNISEEDKNMENISHFVNEWYNTDNKKLLNDAIINTQKYIMNNDFYSTFNNESE